MNVKVMENVYIYKGKMLIESFFFDSAICRNYSPASRGHLSRLTVGTALSIQHAKFKNRNPKPKPPNRRQQWSAHKSADKLNQKGELASLAHFLCVQGKLAI